MLLCKWNVNDAKHYYNYKRYDIICIHCVHSQMPVYVYAVVLFEDEETVAIVHASWIESEPNVSIQ